MNRRAVPKLVDSSKNNVSYLNSGNISRKFPAYNRGINDFTFNISSRKNNLLKEILTIDSNKPESNKLKLKRSSNNKNVYLVQNTDPGLRQAKRNNLNCKHRETHQLLTDQNINTNALISKFRSLNLPEMETECANLSKRIGSLKQDLINMEDCLNRMNRIKSEIRGNRTRDNVVTTHTHSLATVAATENDIKIAKTAEKSSISKIDKDAKSINNKSQSSNSTTFVSSSINSPHGFSYQVVAAASSRDLVSLSNETRSMMSNIEPSPFLKNVKEKNFLKKLWFNVKNNMKLKSYFQTKTKKTIDQFVKQTDPSVTQSHYFTANDHGDDDDTHRQNNNNKSQIIY